MEAKKANVVFVMAKPQSILSEGLRRSANLHTLVVSGPRDTEIPEGVEPDWIVCCETPIDIAIVPCLTNFYDRGHGILGLGHSPAPLISLLIDPESPWQNFSSALKLLQKIPRRFQDYSLAEYYQNFTIEDIIVLFERLVNLRLPGSHERADRVIWLAVQVGRELGLSADEIREISAAARLREIGKIGLPDSYLFRDRSLLFNTDLKFYENYAALGASILRSVPELAAIAQIVDCQLENVDGTGPANLSGSDIPIGAKILRACSAYERVEASLGPDCAKDVLSELWKGVNQVYDSDTLATLDSIVTKREMQDYFDGQHIPLKELRPGMILCQSVYSTSGVRLLAYGAMVNANRIGLIVEQLKRSGQSEVVVFPRQIEPLDQELSPTET